MSAPDVFPIRSTRSTPMKTFSSVAPMRRALERLRRRGCVGFVPTMGALHAGHEALVRRCRRDADVTVVSIFVNPTQFGPNEDYSRYPRTLAADKLQLQAAGTDVLFVPTVRMMYPADYATYVDIGGPALGLCGESRPGHFRGVATVVVKLLNIVQPDLVYFGEKDFQQLQVIRRVVRDLNMDVKIVAVPTVRDKDGLALSSRNRYLDRQQRLAATAIPRALFEARRLVADGERRVGVLVSHVRRRIQSSGAVIDYVAVVDEKTLEPVAEIVRPVRLAVAVRYGQTRLIDNIRLYSRLHRSDVGRADQRRK